MSTKRLIGTDGKIGTFTKGAVIQGDGTKALDDGFYIALQIANETGLPEGLKCGYIFKADNTVIPKEGDNVIPLTFVVRCDVKSASLEFTKEEIDVTTLCDDTKKYRAGFSEAKGSLEGITTVNKSEDIIGKFIPTVNQGADLKNVEIKDVNGEPLYLNMEINKESTDKEAVAGYIAPIILLSYSASVAKDGEQTFSSDFRITPDDYIKAAFYKIETV